jgi:hypothetical protein
MPSLIQALRRLASRALALDPVSAVAHSVIRQIVWDFDLAELTLDEDGTSPLAGPEAHVIRALDGLLTEGGTPEALLSFANAQFPENPYWIDLQSYAHGALVELGEEIAAGRVADEVARFVGRAPETILQGYFRGKEVAFVSESCRPWLHKILTDTTAGGSSSGGEPRESMEGAGSGALSDIRSLLAEGRPRDALTLAVDAEAASRDLRERIEFRLRAAQAALRVRKPQVAKDLCLAAIELGRGADLGSLFPKLKRELLETLLQASGKGPEVGSQSGQPTIRGSLLALSLESLRRETKKKAQ